MQKFVGIKIIVLVWISFCWRSAEGLVDFVGQPEVVDQAKAFIQNVSSPEWYKKVGVPRVKGLLITGDEGTGKTELTKKITGEWGASLVPITADQLMKKGIFWGEPNEQQFFDAVCERTDKVVVAIDGFGRILCDTDKKNRLKAQLDRLDDRFNVVVVGEMINSNVDDKFLSEIGFEKLTIPLPDKQGRCEMLEYCLRHCELEHGVQWKQFFEKLCRVFTPMTFDLCRKLTKDVGRVAAKARRSYIKKEDFEKVLSKMSTSVVKSEQELAMTACHEAGHALAAVYVGRNVYKVSIAPSGDSLGFTRFDGGDDELARTKNDFLCDIVISLGGVCAEEMVYGTHSKGGTGDFVNCTEKVKELVDKFGMGDGDCEMTTRACFSSEKMKEKFDESAVKILSRCKQVTRDVLEEHRTEHEKLSLALLEKESLCQLEVYKITGGPRAFSFR